ncbi:hypothetical protein DSO57_1034686 [Entomophthora muscae]|uniref:Uncharacterized protein n=1 Tax=Entomophthora muscae TaxID=34485 RepID=A0ACC2S1X8_9FUNG|nr:hypothetical protein DSO57_1034686 [Entomophthora muscae]
MKYIVSFFFAALVSGQEFKFDVESVKDLCSINATVFAVNPARVFKINIKSLLKDESEVVDCKAMSRANIFRKIDLRNEFPISTEVQLKLASTVVDNLILFYEHPDYKFYDGFEFNIRSLNEDKVDRLLKLQHQKKLVSLLLSVNKWSEVQKAISKYAGKIHHLEVSVEDNRESLETLKGLLERYPGIKVSVTIAKDKKHTKILSEKTTASLSRNIGYTVYLSSRNTDTLSYTTGI